MFIHPDKFILEKMKEMADCKTILDIGGGEPFQKWLKPYRHLFENCDYKTMDPDGSTGPDLVGDIHKIPLADASVEGVICSSVLEHIEDPHRAVGEMNRILKQGGKIFVYVPSIYPYHARKGHYPDYWRFFDDTLKMLFKEFGVLEIEKRGGYFSALSFFVPWRHKIPRFFDGLAGCLDRAIKSKRRSTTSGYYLYAVKQKQTF